MTAIVLPVMLIMFAFVLVVGYLYDAQARLDAAGNALAATFAEQALLLPMQSWAQLPALDGIGTANGVPQGSFVLNNFSPFVEAGPGARINAVDAWAPAVLQVDTTFNKPIGPLIGLSTAFLGRSIDTIPSRNSARLSQLHLGNFYMARERVMFVLDYSKSMRLHYQGSDGAGSPKSGLDVMQETGSEVIRNFSAVFDAGVLLFSDGKTGNSVEQKPLGTTQAQAQGSSTDPNAHANELAGLVGSNGTMGNGTDLAAAIASAQQLLNNASADQQQLYSNQRMIIITDGEPDYGSGIPEEGDYLMRVRAAEAAADVQMDLAKQMGTRAQVVFMERTQPDPTVLEVAENWLKQLGGTKDPASRSDPNNFHTDARDPGELLKWLLAQPSYPVCYSEAIDGGTLKPPVPTVMLPGSGEVLNAYFDMSQATGYRAEQQVGTVFYGPASENKDAFLTATQQAGATVTQPGTSSVQLDQLKDPNKLIVWLDTDTRRVWLSPLMCAAVTSPQNTGQQMRVRLRWGSPRPVQPGDEALDVLGYRGL